MDTRTVVFSLVVAVASTAASPALAACIPAGGPLLDPLNGAAFLVFPSVIAQTAAEGGRTETTLVIKNASNRAVVAHVAFLNGESADASYCYECDFDVPVQGYGTTTLLLSRANGVTKIRDQGTGLSRSCAFRRGFVTVDAEDTSHRVLTDNVLRGQETVTNYTTGSTFTVRAFGIQGGTGNQDRTFAFDGSEYRKLPAFVETDFTAPDLNGPTTARLYLFTLGFRRQVPPRVDCSVIGWPIPQGGQLSNSFQFGCFSSIRLQDIDPQFAYPNLGSKRGHLRLTCTVNGADDNVGVGGGVHGILVQSNATSTWATLLTPSPTAGCAERLRLGEAARGGGW